MSTSSSSTSNLTTDEVAEALKALANPARLQIMTWLRNPEAEFADYPPIADPVAVGVCATHIQAKSGLAQSTISAHMAVLEHAGLVISTRVGKWTHYRRNTPLLHRVEAAVSDLA